MAHFFLHVRHDDALVTDPEGSEYADVGEARAAALSAARDLWRSAIVSGHDLSDHHFEIVDALGLALDDVAFTDALPLGLRARLRKGSNGAG